MQELNELNLKIQQDGIAFGKYRLFAKLAIGGMAEVFWGRQEGLGGFCKPIVVKCILPFYSQNQEMIDMFLEEARFASYLNHPNIVQLQDVGVSEGVYYMAMEYIAGQNLKELGRRLYSLEKYRREPPYELLTSICVQALLGLEHIHQAKDQHLDDLLMIHRDISPDNLLLSYDGHLKIIDFGMLKAKSRRTSTKVGALKGRLGYMSPEQLKKETLDQRTDIFSLGVVLYELTTNRRLFKRSSEASTIRALLTGDIPLPSMMVRGYPPILEQILLKSLRLDSRDRYGSAFSMRNALSDWLDARPSAKYNTQKMNTVMEELFAQEKTRAQQGLYGKFLTYNDLLNLAPSLYDNWKAETFSSKNMEDSSLEPLRYPLLAQEQGDKTPEELNASWSWSQEDVPVEFDLTVPDASHSIPFLNQSLDDSYVSSPTLYRPESGVEQAGNQIDLSNSARQNEQTGRELGSSMIQGKNLGKRIFILIGLCLLAGVIYQIWKRL